MEHEQDHTHHSRGVVWVIIQAALFLFFIAALISGETMDDFTGLVYLRSAGILIALFGSFVSFWSFRQFGAKVSPFPRPVEDARLVETGPYKYVRHPMYSGIIAFAFGTGLAYANIAAMLAGVLFFLFFLAKTGHEEEMLVESVPGYRKYRSQVGWRLLPRVI